MTSTESGLNHAEEFVSVETSSQPHACASLKTLCRVVTKVLVQSAHVSSGRTLLQERTKEKKRSICI